MKKIYSLITALAITIAAHASPPGWDNTVQILVTNNTATTAYNYQARLIVDTQTPISLGQMNASGNDIRFGKDCVGSTLFNYWIESGINTTSTVIWVKLDTLLASATKTIYMYFGNSTATPSSAVPGVFNGPYSSTDSVASGNAGGATSSQRGFRFAPNEDLLMTAVGKREPNGTTRYVTLFDFATQAVVTQQQVSGPAAQYSYANLATPIWLTQGTQYVLELYQGAADGYYFGTSSQIGQHLTYYDMRYCNSCTQNTFPTNVLSNYHYGYPDMWYWTKTTLSVAPTVSIGSTAALTVTSAGATTICLGDSTSMSVSVSGGITPYTYNWLPSAGVGNPTSSSTMVSPSASGTYTCTIFDGCNTGALDSVTITVNNLPAIIASMSADSICIGGAVTPNGQGGLTYVWSDSLTDGVSFAPTVTDVYVVTGTDANGCVNTDSTTVEVLPLPTVNANASNTTICENSSTVLTGSGALTYVWDNGVNDGDTVTLTTTTTYVMYGTDQYGCEDSASITITVNPNPIVTVSGPTTACNLDGAFTLNGTPSGGSFQGPGVSGNTFDPATAGIGTHVISYSFVDSLGCSAMDTMSVVVDLCLNITGTSNAEFVHVFPNPFENTITVQLQQAGTANMIITNSLGQVLMNQQINGTQITVDTEMFAAGIYFMEIQSANGKQTVKIVKNK